MTSFLIRYLWAGQQFILSLVKPTSYEQRFTTAGGFVLQLATKNRGIVHHGLSVRHIQIRSRGLTELLLWDCCCCCIEEMQRQSLKFKTSCKFLEVSPISFYISMLTSFGRLTDLTGRHSWVLLQSGLNENQNMKAELCGLSAVYRLGRKNPLPQ